MTLHKQDRVKETSKQTNEDILCSFGPTGFDIDTAVQQRKKKSD